MLARPGRGSQGPQLVLGCFAFLLIEGEVELSAQQSDDLLCCLPTLFSLESEPYKSFDMTQRILHFLQCRSRVQLLVHLPEMLSIFGIGRLDQSQETKFFFNLAMIEIANGLVRLSSLDISIQTIETGDPIAYLLDRNGWIPEPRLSFLLNCFSQLPLA